MLKSDTTVPATGYHTECGLEDALYELGVDYDVAGNAVKPRKLINATHIWPLGICKLKPEHNNTAARNVGGCICVIV